MALRERFQHQIDLIFPIVLFFLFSLFSLAVLLMSARVYRSTIRQTLREDNARSSLSYLMEKIHQNDRENAVALGSFDSCPAVILSGEENYVTYLYYYDGALRELFTSQEASVTAASGRDILPLKGLRMEEKLPGLITFTAVDEELHLASVTVGLGTIQEGSHG